MDLLTILPAIIPALTDGVRGLVARFTGSAGAQPQNIDEVIQLENARTERLRALAEIDKPGGNVSLWVANLRASSRYIAVFVVIVYGAVLSVTDADEIAVSNAQQLMAQAFFFLFGDRVYLNLAKR